jgi:hypothetical protein
LSAHLASTIKAQVKNALRILTVAIALASWLAISNHCAVAGIALRSQQTKSGCPFHSKPAEPQNPPSGIQCCKILRAVTSAAAKAIAPAVVNLGHIVPLDAPAHLPVAPGAFAPETVDTGPPGTTSFTELIGSVQAHAPPSRA